MTTHDSFPTDVTGLPAATSSTVAELADGDELELRIAPVAKRIGDATVRMLAYNGSIPGPTLKVREGSEVVVDVVNEGDLEATVHWHGLRVENRYDGTHHTQPPIDIGERFAYRLRFDDPGLFWYHPHIREDYAQELGLYGNILVVPAEGDYWPAVDRELVLTLDDVLLEDGKVAPFSRSETTHVAMGRYGDTMLVGGEPDLALAARPGEVVRLYLTNTAATRVFDVVLEGARMKLVGGDSGRCEREELVDSVLLAPSERAVVDVRFDEPGTLLLEHSTPDRRYRLAAIEVGGGRLDTAAGREFEVLRHNGDMAAERERVAPYLAAEPDKVLAFVAEMDMGVPEGAVVFSCPMHPEVVSAEVGRCPKCGMKLLAVAVTYVCPMHPEVVSDSPDERCPRCGMKLLPAHLAGGPESMHGHGGHEHGGHEDAHGGHAHGGHEPGGHEHGGHEDAHGEHGHGHEGESHGHGASGGIEWEDDMVDVNRMTTPANTVWKLVDRTPGPGAGKANQEIDWRFSVGDQVKLRLVNEMDSDHPMQHPFHVHGAGRFLVLSRDGVDEPNLVWKDTVLVRTGETVDILLDVTNPGIWMAHCHIAEHHESGMMLSFRVDPGPGPA